MNMDLGGHYSTHYKGMKEAQEKEKADGWVERRALTNDLQHWLFIRQIRGEREPLKNSFLAPPQIF